MDAHHDFGRPVSAGGQGVGGWISGESSLTGLVLSGEFAEAPAEFGCRKGFGLGAFRADGGEEGGVRPVKRFEGVEVRF